MLHVILRNRKVLRYNNGANTNKDGDLISINDSSGHWIAQIPISVIERIEAIKPCKIMKARPAPKKANY